MTAQLPSIPNREQLSQYVVNRVGWEGIRQTLYDSAVYAAAGQTQLTFFALPLGQGTGFGGGAKTLTDTNMNLAGQLPTNQEFLIQSIEVSLLPATPTVAAAMPSAFGAAAVAASVNDEYIFRRAGNLQFVVGSKPYLQEAPLMKFPPKARFEIPGGAASDTTTAGATQAFRAVWGANVGRPYMLHPASILLTSNQNFSITLNWPEGVQAIANPARVYVTLDGFLYRRSQ